MYLIKTFLLAGIPVGIISWLIVSVTGNFQFSLEIGIFSGTVWGLITFGIALILRFTSKRYSKEEMPTDCTILYMDGAYHLKNQYVVGCLTLTPEELYYKSLRYIIQSHQKKIPLEQILEVKKVWFRWFIPDGIEIITHKGSEKFAVFNRNLWIREISAAKQEREENIRIGISRA